MFTGIPDKSKMKFIFYKRISEILQFHCFIPWIPKGLGQKPSLTWNYRLKRSLNCTSCTCCWNSWNWNIQYVKVVGPFQLNGKCSIPVTLNYFCWVYMSPIIIGWEYTSTDTMFVWQWYHTIYDMLNLYIYMYANMTFEISMFDAPILFNSVRLISKKFT